MDLICFFCSDDRKEQRADYAPPTYNTTCSKTSDRALAEMSSRDTRRDVQTEHRRSDRRDPPQARRHHPGATGHAAETTTNHRSNRPGQQLQQQHHHRESSILLQDSEREDHQSTLPAGRWLVIEILVPGTCLLIDYYYTFT